MSPKQAASAHLTAGALKQRVKLARGHAEGQRQGKEPSPGPCLHNNILKPPLVFVATPHSDKSLFA